LTSFDASLCTSINYGIDDGMGEMRKITVEVPEDLLEKAQEFTGVGISETVRKGLELLRQREAQQRVRALRGKIKFGVDLMALRALED
jgi:Arc/MetJ-type ribon-helix-helix transcriptional regulator